MRNLIRLSARLQTRMKSPHNGTVNYGYLSRRDLLDKFTPTISVVPHRHKSEFIFKSSLPDVHIPDMKWFDFISSHLGPLGDAPAFIFPAQNVTQRFSDLDSITRRIASGFLRHGFQNRECVCMVLNNCPEYQVTVYAVTNIGGIVTTMNPEFTLEEMTRQLKASSSRYIVTSEAYLETVKQAAAEAGNIKEIIVREDGGDLGPGFSRFSKYQNDDGSRYKEIEVDVDNDVALLPYSSGTTGLPKGVMLTHKNLVANSCQTMGAFGCRPGELSLTFVPSFHISGLVVTSTIGVLAGMGFVIMDKFDGKKYLEYLSKYKCSSTGIVPPVANFLARSDLVDQYDLSNLDDLVCGAAPLSADLQQIVSERINVVIRQAYGMTELSPMLTIGERGVDLPGAAGRIAPNTELKILDVDTGESLGYNEVGEIVARGPQVMKGYLNNKEATDKTIINGWLHTGDVGYMAENGYLYVSDRVKELIKYKAFQVAPAELEGILMSHDSIADCGVIGIPNQDTNELPRAYVVTKEGHHLTEKDVLDYVAERVAPYKKLRGGVKFLETIPRAASGKILRRELRLRGD